MQDYRHKTKDGCYGYSRNGVTGQVTLTKKFSSDSEAYLCAIRVDKGRWNVWVESYFTEFSVKLYTYASTDLLKEIWRAE